MVTIFIESEFGLELKRKAKILVLTHQNTKIANTFIPAFTNPAVFLLQPGSIL